MTIFIQVQKQKHLSMKVTSMKVTMYSTIIANISNVQEKPHINISKYNPLVGSSYIKLPNKLDHPRKGLINIQNIDDIECFKQCLLRYLYPVDHDPRRITKLDFKNIKFPVKI